MHELSVLITRYVDDNFPGWVACEFVDAYGRRHVLVDKVPIFSGHALNALSVYPLPGSARCTVLERWIDADGRSLARISTESPDYIESREGSSEFVVLSTQLKAVS